MTQTFSPSLYETPFYSLLLSYSDSHFIVKGRLLNGLSKTTQIPQTSQLLEQYLPQIFSCSCFNDANIPFSQELQQTELGHLLEHILLEFLCKEKLSHGATSAVFDGVTKWYVDTPQEFEIFISKDKYDLPLFAQALKRSLFVFDKIISTP